MNARKRASLATCHRPSRKLPRLNVQIIARPTNKSFNRTIARRVVPGDMQRDGKNSEEQYVRNALSQPEARPDFPISHARPRKFHLSVRRSPRLIVRRMATRNPSQQQHPRLLPNISICFPSVKQRRDASRRVSSRERSVIGSPTRSGVASSPLDPADVVRRNLLSFSIAREQ